MREKIKLIMRKNKIDNDLIGLKADVYVSEN